MRRVLLVLALTVLVGLFALGVGVVGGAASTNGDGARAAATGVRVADNVFRPGRVSIRRRGVVTWRWVGRNRHNVVGPRFRSRVLRRGRYSHRFRRRGSYRVVCTLHPGMRMTVRVR